MTRATFMLLHAIVALAFGIAFVFAPALVLALYGVATDATGTFMARLFAAALIQVGLVAWLARKVTDAAARGAVQLGYAGGLSVGLVIAPNRPAFRPLQCARLVGGHDLLAAVRGLRIFPSEAERCLS